MKTNACFLATIVTVALATCTSFAQVHSVNAIGFVKQSVPPNGLNMISVPLNGTNNNLNTTLALPNGYDGATIFRFDRESQNYRDPISWIENYGWYSASDLEPTVNPGEGIWIQNPASTTLNITFLGDVPSGTFLTPIIGNNGNSLNLLASVIPKDVKLSELPAADGDTVFIFDPGCQCYKDPFSYITGYGWFSANPDDPGPTGYTVPPARGFWYQVAGPSKTWTQTFSVN